MKLYESSQFSTRAEEILEEWSALISTKLEFLSLEHIGSTAVEGALTKGDIDLYLEVPASEHPAAVETLVKMGLTVAEDSHRDESLCMLKHTDFAIQVVAKGSKYEFFKEFRDLLINDQTLLANYNQLKIASANLDSTTYRANKAQFIESVLAGQR